MRMLILKNGGDSSDLRSTNESYGKIQQTLADEVAKHIAQNPVNQQIESVTIKWKEPIIRVYDYLIEED